MTSNTIVTLFKSQHWSIPADGQQIRRLRQSTSPGYGPSSFGAPIATDDCMDTESFGYSLLAKTNGVVETRVITVGAALDVDSYVQFAPDLEWTPKCRCEIIIDCAALKIVSTVGLGFFLLVDAHARKHFGHARIVNCNEDVARVLQTATDFTSRFRMPFERAAAK